MLCNVLIVDDSSSARSILRRVVRAAGVRDERIFEAANGQEALALFEDAWIDLVLLDVNMPVMSGECFVRTIRAREDLADLRVIVVTAENSPLRHARLRTLGVTTILTKPFETEALRSAIIGSLPRLDAA
jgi:CheY-like chemotaxis protein